MRATNAVSPPRVTISDGAPVQTLDGGRDFRAEEARRSAGEVKKGGLVRVKSMLGDRSAFYG